MCSTRRTGKPKEVCVCVCSILIYTYMYTASQVRRKDKGKEAVEAVGSLDDFVAELLGLRTDPSTLPYDQWKQKVGGVGGREHYERTELN
jgi:hypothetical protein